MKAISQRERAFNNKTNKTVSRPEEVFFGGYWKAFKTPNASIENFLIEVSLLLEFLSLKLHIKVQSLECTKDLDKIDK